ncbi:DUF6318 family protein [Jatrophihabitans sp. DSM 45814]
MRLNAGFVVAVVCVAVAVVGCGSGSQGGRSGPVVGSSAGSASAVGSGSSSPGVVASPGPTASVVTTGPNLLPGQTRPVPPAGLMEHTQRGAQATAVFFWAAIDWGYSTGDGSVLRGVSTDGCKPCREQLAIFDDVGARDLHFRGGHIAVRRIATVSESEAKKYGQLATDTTIDAERVVTVDRGGKVTGAGAAAVSFTQRIFVTWVGSGWRVTTTARIVNQK